MHEREREREREVPVVTFVLGWSERNAKDEGMKKGGMDGYPFL